MPKKNHYKYKNISDALDGIYNSGHTIIMSEHKKVEPGDEVELHKTVGDPHPYLERVNKPNKSSDKKEN